MPKIEFCQKIFLQNTTVRTPVWLIRSLWAHVCTIQIATHYVPVMCNTLKHHMYYICIICNRYVVHFVGLYYNISCM